jgi:transposase InsO family protein
LGTSARGRGAVGEAGYLRFSAYGPRLLASRTGATRPSEDLFANWKTFVRNHAQSIVACDFLVVVTARFRTLYVFLLMEVGTRRIAHCNVTARPTAAWTLQQLREAIRSDHSYRFLIHHRDSTCSAEVDHQLKAVGLRVLHTPARAPKANAYCERLVGSVGRECLDFMIPVGRNICAESCQSGFLITTKGAPI